MVHYSFTFTVYKAAIGRSYLWCGTAKSISGSTQIVSMGQQKSSPQLVLTLVFLGNLKY